jgi:hypothetical protein
MQSRRQFLQDALIAPMAVASLGTAAGPRIIAEPDCLSQESAQGFRTVLHKHGLANLIVVCGAAMHPRLRAAAVNGAWVVWEISPFRNQSSLAIPASPGDLYVRYTWPRMTLTRSFSHMIPIQGTDTEVIAYYRDVPMALKRRMGRGGIIYLGSMLGPNLQAEEREAHELATAIFSEIACADTSTAASASM